MKKIGILTFHQAINYGAILQTYALQFVLADKFDVSIINYRSEKFEKEYYKLKLRYKIIKFFYETQKEIKKKKFIDFSNRRLKLTERINEKKELSDFCCNYDYIITGSDQVWNYRITNTDWTYLLDFVEPMKRLSYAASFGVSDIPDDLKEHYRKLLSKFKYITVREKQGQEIIKELCNIDVPVVLDPTLLLNKNDWESICDNKIDRNKYILVYCLRKSKTLLNFAKKLKEDTGLEIIYLNPRRKHSFGRCSAAKAGPEEFVELFLNADYIVTNSFHGTIFAINFNKKFVVDLDTGEGNTNSRIEGILDIFGLNNRIVQDVNLNKMYNNIDYNKINEKISYLREDSLSVLFNMINGNRKVVEN